MNFNGRQHGFELRVGSVLFSRDQLVNGTDGIVVELLPSMVKLMKVLNRV